MPTEMINEKNSDGSPNPIENESTADRVRLEQIVTGGQAGVDRAALDAARDAGIPAGGWCPKGRIAIDGRIPDIYALQETPSSDYAERTTWNVRDSDGTLVLIAGEPTGGTAFTIDEAKRLGQIGRASCRETVCERGVV